MTFPPSCKTFCDFILIMHILFCCVNQKNEKKKKEKKIEHLKVYLLTEEPSASFTWLNIENDFCQILCAGSWIIYETDYFLWPNVLPKVNIIIDLLESILTCIKSAEWLLIWNRSKSAQWPVWKSLYLKWWRS